MDDRSMRPSAAALRLENLSKRYGDVAAVDDISLSVRPGEFLTLLGPSGSGKTTTLRMVAGFARPTSGRIQMGDREITGLPPDKRDIGMVFQNYALFPHLTAARNIAFPLEMRHVPRPEIRRRVDDALALVRLADLGNRYPRELSGGQQQRIALARAVVFQPGVLLMDEPLGALDKKLRESLQVEILSIKRRLGITVIYVTHDQEEALGMSDRIAVFNQGRIEQIGSGEELYERPASLFVADFVGESTILPGRLARDASGTWLDGPLGRHKVQATAPAVTDLPSGAEAALVIRPDRIQVISVNEAEGAGAMGGASGNAVLASVVEVLYLGSTRKLDLRLADGTRAVVREPTGSGEERRVPGDQVQIRWEPADGVLVPGNGVRATAVSGVAIRA